MEVEIARVKNTLKPTPTLTTGEDVLRPVALKPHQTTAGKEMHVIGNRNRPANAALL